MNKVIAGIIKATKAQFVPHSWMDKKHRVITSIGVIECILETRSGANRQKSLGRPTVAKTFKLDGKRISLAKLEQLLGQV